MGLTSLLRGGVCTSPSPCGSSRTPTGCRMATRLAAPRTPALEQRASRKQICSSGGALSCRRDTPDTPCLEIDLDVSYVPRSRAPVHWLRTDLFHYDRTMHWHAAGSMAPAPGMLLCILN